MTKRPLFKRRRHVARSARILSTGISATVILAMTAAYAAAEQGPSATGASTTTVGMPATMVPVGFTDTGKAQPSLAPLGETSTSSAPLAVVTSVETRSPNNSVTTVDSVAPGETIAPEIAIAPEITVAPITAAPIPVQLEVPKSSNGSTSGGSR